MTSVHDARRARRRRARVGLLVVAALVAASCDPVTDPASGEPQVTAIRLTVGGQVITVSSGASGGPVSIPIGATTVSAQFLMANGQPDSRVTAALFQLNVIAVGGAPITFQRSNTNPFAGTLTATAGATGATLGFALFHVEEQHNDFGPVNVTFNVGG